MVDPKSLAARIKAFYPEIERSGVDLSIHFDEATKAWMVKLAKGEHVLETHVEAKDAQDCLEGRECVYLTTQVARFVEAYCLRDKECPR